MYLNHLTTLKHGKTYSFEVVLAGNLDIDMSYRHLVSPTLGHVSRWTFDAILENLFLRPIDIIRLDLGFGPAWCVLKVVLVKYDIRILDTKLGR